MAEVGVSIAAKVVEYLVDPAIQQLQYLFCVGKITSNFETKREELILKKGRVQERIQQAINRTERIDDEVNDWKNEVESLIAEVENTEQELRANNGCIQRWCPTWRRYCLSRKLMKTTQRMTELHTKSDHFNPFSHSVIVPGIEYHFSKDFVLFESTRMARDQLWKALQDDGSFIIGLWGMGGSGKTTLVKEVGKKAKETKLFDHVVFTAVSQTLDMRNIQGEIADTLGLKLEEESETGRAKRIAMRLQSSNERILIILDDVWAKLNLDQVGNPFGEEGLTNNKVLLTTRRQDVCTLMDCQKNIRLHLLTENESWALFQAHAKVDDSASEIVAQEVVKECMGLPIAIVAVGASLKGKGTDEIKVILDKLKHSKPIDVDEGVRDAFACLELSYNYLRSSNAKLIFLMCAMFPEDHKICIEDLFRYGVGLGLCEDADSFEIARSQLTTAINVLIDSSLLMPSLNFMTEKYVTMHDMVRDVALWIASKEHRMTMVNQKNELNELVQDKTVKDCYAVSSWGNKKLLQFPAQLDAPKLEILLLNPCKSLDLSNASFEGVKGLKVVAMIFTGYSLPSLLLQPQSIQWLSNLRTLRLQMWYLGDISFVLSLTKLEILDFQGSEFKKLPNGIEKLNKLKLLDLSRCTIDECCYKVIGMCSQLEELYYTSPHGSVKCTECLVGIAAFPKLRRYVLQMGQRMVREFLTERMRALCLGELNISISSAIIKDLAQRAIAIEFHRLQGGYKSFIPDMVQALGDMSELTKLCFRRCSDIEYLTNKAAVQEDVVNPKLVELQLEDMDNLKQLCHGLPLLGLFQNLESLNISNCPQLLNLFPANCNLGNLKKLHIHNCSMLMSLFPVSIARTLLSLNGLTIRGCSQLKHVIEGEDAAENDTQIVFPLLEYLNLIDLPNLLGICSESYHPSWPSLKKVMWTSCPRLETSFDPLMISSEQRQPRVNMERLAPNGRQVRNEESKPLATVSNIESIDLYNCGLESVFHYRSGVEVKKATTSNTLNLCLQIPIFPYLKTLYLMDCAKLKFVFSDSICQSLLELTSLAIDSCEELQEIFAGNEDTQKNQSTTQVCLPKLEFLEIEECNKLKFIFSIMASAASSMLPKLSTLSISNASHLEEIFRCSNIEDCGIDSGKEITFPNLKRIKLEKLPRLVNVCQGFKLHIVKSCRVVIHECPKIVPTVGVSTWWTEKEGLVRKHVVKYSQLSNNEAHSLPLSVLNLEELDIESAGVQVYFQVIGDGGDDDDDEQVKNLEMMRSEHQILKDLGLTQVLSFQYLHQLEVVRCKKLKFLFPISTIVHNSLPKLTFLFLYGCEELEEIITNNEEPQNISNAQGCFPQLRNLKISSCNKLRKLFSTIMATFLPQLDSLVINKADQLEVIFGHGREDDANSGEIFVLPNLREIRLANLPNLINVCQGLQLQAVQLCTIVICECPKFLDPILGSTQMVSLQQWGTTQFQIGANVEKQLPVNEEEGMIMISSVEKLSLKHSDNLMPIWEVPTSISFQNLRWLKVIRCRKLKSIFPCTVIRSLPCLEFLYIKECEELVEIISERHGQKLQFPNASSNFSCFPHLAKLVVEQCGKLKRLFSSVLSNEDLQQLEYLNIKRCRQLERVFSGEVEIHEEGLNKNVLPKLKTLRVEDCPIFSKTTLQGRNTDHHQGGRVPSWEQYHFDDFHVQSLSTVEFLEGSVSFSNDDDWLYGRDDDGYWI